MKKTIIYLTLTLAISYQALSQQNLSRQLNVGDYIPDLYIGKIINKHIPQKKISEFNSDIILLDFWNRWCSYCISTFPKLEKLSNIYKGKVAIIPITADREEEFRQARSRSKILQETSLPLVIEDTTFTKMFPHKAVPYYVWIDRAGKIIALSSASSLTEYNINNMLSGKKIEYLKPQHYDIPNKTYEELISDKKKRSLPGSTLIYYSDFVLVPLDKYSPRSSLIRDSIAKTTIGWRKHGNTLLDLFAFAYNTSKNNILIKDSSLNYLRPPQDEQKLMKWYESSIYNYEIIMPIETFRASKKWEPYLQNDLKNEFGINAEWIETEVNCLALHKKAFVKLKPPSDSIITSERTQKDIYIKNGNIANLIENIRHTIKTSQIVDHLIVDETGINYRFDLTMTLKDNSLSSINKALNEIGLSLKESKKKIKYLHITSLKQVGFTKAVSNSGKP